MIRVRTPSRLHFGLLSLPGARSTGQRVFGGVGLMIDKPGIELTVACSPTWAAVGPLSERALKFARSYCSWAGIGGAFQIEIVAAAPEHVGLGTGTQLGLAVARAIAELTQQPDRDAVSLAQHVGRGKRSAVGVHGFERGGYIMEGGKIAVDKISPLLVGQPFPTAWQIVLITPRHLIGTHGKREVEAFVRIFNEERDEHANDALPRIALLGMLPAILEQDLAEFGEALHDFNRRCGELFHAVQGGVYAHPRIEEIVAAVRDFGVKGVGQSSWGPTVFAVVAGVEAGQLCDWLSLNHGVAKEEMYISAACNHGAMVSA